MPARKKAAPRKKTAKKKKKAALARKKKKAARQTPAAWGLAVEGGWSETAFAVGALDRLRKVHGVKEFSVVAGTGAGAFVAALLAQDRWTDLVALHAGLDPKRFLRPRYGRLKRRPLLSVFLSAITRTPSLYLPQDELRRLVVESLDEEALMRSTTELHFVVLDVRSGRPRAFSNRTDSFEELRAALLAAVSPALILPPVAVGAERHPCVDASIVPGAALETCLDAVRRYGGPVADRLLALSTTPPPPERPDAGRLDVLDTAARTLELLAGDGGERSVRGARLTNALLHLAERLGEKELASALGGADDATRAEVARALRRVEVPVLHLRPSGAAGDWRGALRAGAAAVERTIG